MSQLSNISKFQEELIDSTFPNLRDTLHSNVSGHLENKVAISIFDRWLSEENLHLLDCKSDIERKERNAKMLCLWENIFDLTEVYTYVADLGRINFIQYTDKQVHLNDCAYRDDKTSKQFQLVILPEFEAIYYENWDDTNVLWFKSNEKVEPLFKQVSLCGLHIIEYAV